VKGKNRVELSVKLFEYVANQDFDSALRVWKTLPESFLKVRAAGAIKRLAPEGRKSEAEAIVQTLPEYDRSWAQ